MVIPLVLGLCGIAVLPVAQPSAMPPQGSGTTGLIAELERDRASAIEQRDPVALSKLLSDDSQFVTADGRLLDKTERLAAVSRGEVVERAMPPVQPTIRVYETIAVVSGRALQERSADPRHVYFLRVWVCQDGDWRIFITHDTDITPHATAEPPKFVELDAPVPAGKVDIAPRDAARPENIMASLRHSHRAYWAKHADRYEWFAGDDLVRAAETGVRTGAVLIEMMQGNPRLPARPSRQLQMWARVFGNTGVGGWLDSGTDGAGRSALNRFTAVLVWREGRWQIVQLQSNAVPTGTPR